MADGGATSPRPFLVRGPPHGLRPQSGGGGGSGSTTGEGEEEEEEENAMRLRDLSFPFLFSLARSFLPPLLFPHIHFIQDGGGGALDSLFPRPLPTEEEGVESS